MTLSFNPITTRETYEMCVERRTNELEQRLNNMKKEFEVYKKNIPSNMKIIVEDNKLIFIINNEKFCAIPKGTGL
jgi:hypothetical protein